MLKMTWDVEFVVEGDNGYPVEYNGTGVMFYKYSNGLLVIA